MGRWLPHAACSVFIRRQTRRPSPHATAPLPPPPAAPQASWDSFCAFPPSLGAACRRRPECCVMKEGYVYIHLVGQARCMTTAAGG